MGTGEPHGPTGTGWPGAIVMAATGVPWVQRSCGLGPRKYHIEHFRDPRFSGVNRGHYPSLGVDPANLTVGRALSI